MVEYLTYNEILKRDLFFALPQFSRRMGKNLGLILGHTKNDQSTLENESDSWKKSLKKVMVAYEIVGQDNDGYHVNELAESERARISKAYRHDLNRFCTDKFQEKRGRAAVYAEE